MELVARVSLAVVFLLAHISGDYYLIHRIFETYLILKDIVNEFEGQSLS